MCVQICCLKWTERIDILSQVKCAYGFDLSWISNCRLQHTLRWKLFCEYCVRHGVDSVHWHPPHPKKKRKENFSLGTARQCYSSPSVLKVYLAAISVYHSTMEGISLGSHKLMIFLKVLRHQYPPWIPRGLGILSAKQSLWEVLWEVSHILQFRFGCCEWKPQSLSLSCIVFVHVHDTESESSARHLQLFIFSATWTFSQQEIYRGLKSMA